MLPGAPGAEPRIPASKKPALSLRPQRGKRPAAAAARPASAPTRPAVAPQETTPAIPPTGRIGGADVRPSDAIKKP